MKKGIILEKDRRFLTLLTANGEFCKARLTSDLYEIGQEIEFIPVTAHYQKFTWFKKPLFISAALLLLCMSLLIPFYQENKVYAYMSIDVNPGIEVAVNKNMKVIDIIPYNKNGQIVSSQIKAWEKEDLGSVTKKIMNEMKRQGFIKKKESISMTAVLVHNPHKSDETFLHTSINQIKLDLRKEDIPVKISEGTKEERQQAIKSKMAIGLWKDKNKQKTKHNEQQTQKHEQQTQKHEQQQSQKNKQEIKKHEKQTKKFEQKAKKYDQQTDSEEKKNKVIEKERIVKEINKKETIRVKEKNDRTDNQVNQKNYMEQSVSQSPFPNANNKDTEVEKSQEKLGDSVSVQKEIVQENHISNEEKMLRAQKETNTESNDTKEEKLNTENRSQNEGNQKQELKGQTDQIKQEKINGNSLSPNKDKESD
ncbi:anti-sigma factor domain-containing protein [Bacillus sp. 03113]|uniref:anti-sigma factor domain-containing protein n=1 Tax=Bacillus sp. 03113 TaxID=2578211 RepID=UPI0011449399|nr:anti-sigma factor domain-containing protein [Bacillus sp. 03113]